MIITFSKNYLKSFLASTSYHLTESATPGGGRNGVGGGVGAPLRYDYTAPGYCALSPWNQSEFAYSLLQLNSE